MADDSKTEKATSKKRRDERNKGHIFMSKDVISVVGLFGSFYTLKFLFPGIYRTVRDILLKYIALVGSMSDMSGGNIQQIGYELVLAAAKSILPLLFICMALAILATGTQTKFLFSKESMSIKFSRLNPLSGIKNMFSLKNVVELIKSIVKISILGFIVYGMLEKDIVIMMRTMRVDLKVSMAYMLELIIDMVTRVTMIFVAIAAFDYFYQWWDYERQMKMSKEEVKEEFKQAEGDPKVKAKIREIQRKRAMSRMMQNVPDSDVIIRNPTHFAVALKYNPDKNNAPIVVAKGQDQVALRIVKIGEENQIAIIENKPLARGLFASTEVEQEIPAEYYGLVAEILVQVYKANEKKVK